MMRVRADGKQEIAVCVCVCYKRLKLLIAW